MSQDRHRIWFGFSFSFEKRLPCYNKKLFPKTIGSEAMWPDMAVAYTAPCSKLKQPDELIPANPSPPCISAVAIQDVSFRILSEQRDIKGRLILTGPLVIISFSRVFFSVDFIFACHRFSVCSPGWSDTSYVTQASLKLVILPVQPLRCLPTNPTLFLTF